jgi:hypothetical protein
MRSASSDDFSRVLDFVDQTSRLPEPYASIVRVTLHERLTVLRPLWRNALLRLLFTAMPALSKRISADPRREARWPFDLTGNVATRIGCKGGVGAAIMQIRHPYLLFLGDVQDKLAAKTAQAVVDWRRDWSRGQLRMPVSASPI